MSVRAYKDTILLASGARTADQTSATYVVTAAGTEDSYEGLTVILDITAVTGAPSITLSVDEFIPAKNGFSPILQTAALTATGTSHLRIGPTIADVTNRARSQLAPRIFRVRVLHGTADSVTYSLSMNQWSLA